MESAIEKPMSKKGLPKWAKIAIGCAGAFFIGVIVLVALIFGIAYKATSAPTESAKLFLDFGAHEIYGSMYAYASPELQASITEADLKGFTENNPILDNMDHVTFSHKSVENDLAILYGTIYSETDSSPIYMELVKVGDDWLVSYISFDPNDIPKDEEDDF